MELTPLNRRQALGVLISGGAAAAGRLGSDRGRQ
jgi:hypothetical protein